MVLLPFNYEAVILPRRVFYQLAHILSTTILLNTSSAIPAHVTNGRILPSCTASSRHDVRSRAVPGLFGYIALEFS